MLINNQLFDLETHRCTEQDSKIQDYKQTHGIADHKTMIIKNDTGAAGTSTARERLQIVKLHEIGVGVQCPEIMKEIKPIDGVAWVHDGSTLMKFPEYKDYYEAEIREHADRFDIFPHIMVYYMKLLT